MDLRRPTLLTLVAMTACTSLRQGSFDATAARDTAGDLAVDVAVADQGTVGFDAGPRGDVFDAAVSADVADIADIADVAEIADIADIADVAEIADIADIADVRDVPAAQDVDPGALVAPRLRAPLSGAWMSSGRVTFRWFPVPGQEAVVELCRDRRCATVARTLEGGTASSADPPEPLAQGAWWWRVRPSLRGVRGASGTPWFFWVEGRGTAAARETGPQMDLDADGRREVIVGAPGARGASGAVSFWTRGAELVQTTARVFGQARRAGAGWAVAPAGDLDGDGYPEMAYTCLSSALAQGEVAVIRGDVAAQMNSLTLLSLYTDDVTLGTSIAGLGDIDGDGYGDFASARPGPDAGREGAVLVYNGATTGIRGANGVTIPPPNATLRGARPDIAYGRAIAAAGDVDGDGFADLVVGAPTRDPARATGEVDVHRGGSTGLSLVPLRLAAPAPADETFGVAVAGAGDLNADGLADIAVGAPAGAGRVSRVYVYYGTSGGLRATPDVVLAPVEGSIGFGRAVVGAGDVDGDGYADLAVAAPDAPEGGAVYVYRGGPAGLDARAPVVLGNPMRAGPFAERFGTHGDVDGDGVPDLLVGASAYDRNRGRVWVYRGGAGGPERTPWRFVDGVAEGDRFGQGL